jgi:hypothetical protein
VFDFEGPERMRGSLGQPVMIENVSGAKRPDMATRLTIDASIRLPSRRAHASTAPRNMAMHVDAGLTV